MIPFPLILSSPSGGGKTTIARMLLARRVDVGYSTSATTRPPRDGEVDGRDYHFLSREAFEAARGRGEFAESAEVFGNIYGTLKREVEGVLSAGRHVVMDIDVQGARQFVTSFPESVLVFLLPPSADVLLERLKGRNTEAPDALLKRLTGAREELQAVGSYQYVVVNDNLERTFQQVSSIVDAEAVRHQRIPIADDRVRNLIAQIDRHITQFTRTN